MKKTTYARGEICHINFSTDCTYCLQGPHPGFVVDHTLNNIRVIPITSVKLKTIGKYTTVLQPDELNGLTQNSLLLYSQITTVSEEQIMYRRGQLNTETTNIVIKELIKNIM